MIRDKSDVVPSRPRRTARVDMGGGEFWSASIGTRVEEYYKAARPEWVPPFRPEGADDSKTIIAVVVDGDLRELTYPVQRDAIVRPVMLSDGDGMRIYRRSLSFMLVVAVEELFPGRKIRIDHALPFGGFYCAVMDGPPFTPEEIARIKVRMDEMVAENCSIVRKPVPLDEAIALFEQRGDADKLRLMASRHKNYLILYELRGMQDYFYGYMAPSTGYLKTFDLAPDGDGFILRYPRRHDTVRLKPMTALPKLRSVYMETENWLHLLGIRDVGALNQAIQAGRARELILVTEALHESRIADIADEIVARQPNVRLVLIAGPSASGKTTASKRLAIQLMAHGLKPFTLGMDDYFVAREQTPKDEMGEYDYEHLNAVDLPLFNRDLLALMAGQEVQMPRYNFQNGSREEGEAIRLTPEHIIIVEGIHGMNPELVRELPRGAFYRVYISSLTQLNIDRHNRIPTTDTRMLRRIVRDARFRGYTAVDTLERWESVRRGERRWIFPYQEHADVMFNSALVYEIGVLRPLAEPLLLQVEAGTPRYIEAKRLLSFLSWVEPLDPDLIPDNSILREFIGRSILRDYIPGKADETDGIVVIRRPFGVGQPPPRR
jgi:uridine kinase